jgi:hypothetical protein
MECHSNSTFPTIPTVTKSPRNLKESPTPETMVEAPNHSKKRKKKKPTNSVTQKFTTPRKVSSGEDDVQSKTQQECLTTN